MTRIVRLKQEGKQAAVFRGHKLTRYSKLSPRGRCHAVCGACGMGVFIDSHPDPNGIDVGGQAVALTCNSSPYFEPLGVSHVG